MAFIAESVTFDNTVFMAQIEQTLGKEWRVTVLIARPSGSRPIQASEGNVQLFDTEGRGVPDLGSPKGVWVEAGGAAGTTASAEFLFGPTRGAPKLLEVSLNGKIAKLHIHPGPLGRA